MLHSRPCAKNRSILKRTGPWTPARPLVSLVSGQGIVALAGLVYGKLTALYIPPAEWGNYSLLLAAATLLDGFFITPTIQSFKAALVLFPHRQVIRYYSQLIRLIYLVLIVVGALVTGLSDQNSIWMRVGVASVGQGIYQFATAYLNVLAQHRTYAWLQAGYALGNMLLVSLLIIIFGQRTAIGLWQSVAILNGLFAFLALWRSAQQRALVESGSVAPADRKRMTIAYRQYVLPLVSLAFWGWLINYADRYLIQLYLTDADVGQYTMGYSLGSKLLLLVAPLLTLLMPQVLTLRADGQPPEVTNPLLLRYLIRYGGVAGTGCLVFYASRDWIGHWLLSDHYKPAYVIGPIVATGYLFLTGVHLLEVKWYAYGQTNFVLWHHVLGAVLNSTFNLLLIPQWGIVGAALATLMGFLGQFVLAFWLFTSSDSTHQ